MENNGTAGPKFSMSENYNGLSTHPNFHNTEDKNIIKGNANPMVKGVFQDLHVPKKTCFIACPPESTCECRQQDVLTYQPIDLRQQDDKLSEKANNAIRYNQDKNRLTLIPPDPLEEIAKVMEFGAKKYSDWNWTKGFRWLSIADSLLRHLYAWMRGEDNDPESGLSHLAHCGCNIIFLLYHEKYKKELDNRHKTHEAGKH